MTTDERHEYNQTLLLAISHVSHAMVQAWCSQGRSARFSPDVSLLAALDHLTGALEGTP